MRKVELACIIDDDPIFVFGVRKFMELINFCESFLIFNNGQEALDKLSAIIRSGEQTPEVILLDINMPILDGWGFLDEFIKITPPKEITIYIVTSSIDPADTEKAKSYESINDYIVKPITMDGLKEILQSK